MHARFNCARVQLQATQRPDLKRTYNGLTLADQNCVDAADGVEEGELEVAPASGAVLQHPDHNVA